VAGRASTIISDWPATRPGSAGSRTTSQNPASGLVRPLFNSAVPAPWPSPHRHRAVTPLRKSLRLHAKRVIKTRAVIFPRQSRCQFHQLRVRELLPQLCKQRVRHLDRRQRHRIRVLQNQPFDFRKPCAAFVLRQRHYLVLRNPSRSADRRTDVNSKWAPHQRGYPQLRQIL